MKRVATSLAAAALLASPLWAEVRWPDTNTTANTVRPSIGIDFEQPIRKMQLFVDGVEVTTQAQSSGTRIQWTPSTDLAQGNHTVQARGLNFLGLPLEYRWNFSVNNNNNNWNGNGQQQPGNVGLAVNRVTPSQNDVVQNQRPTINVNYSQILRSARVWLDGNDITSQVRISSNSFEVTPQNELSAGRHQVAVEAVSASGNPFTHNWSFEVAASHQGGHHRHEFSNLRPEPRAELGRGDRRPQIAADIPSNLRNVRILVDGEEVTSQADVQRNRVAYTPDQDLDRGEHRVRIEGTASNGQISSTEWTFQVRGRRDRNDELDNNPPQPQFSVDEPVRGARVDKVFDVSGQARPGSQVRIVVRPLPKRNRTVQFSGNADRAGFYSIPVSASWATRGTRIEVQVTSVDRQTQKPNATVQTFEVIRR